MQVERARQARVIEIRLADRHGVLVGAEVGETMAHEVAQGAARLRRGDGVVEGVEAAGVMRELPRHHVHHLSCDGVG